MNSKISIFLLIGGIVMIGAIFSNDILYRPAGENGGEVPVISGNTQITVEGTESDTNNIPTKSGQESSPEPDIPDMSVDDVPPTVPPVAEPVKEEEGALEDDTSETTSSSSPAGESSEPKTKSTDDDGNEQTDLIASVVDDDRGVSGKSQPDSPGEQFIGYVGIVDMVNSDKELIDKINAMGDETFLVKIVDGQKIKQETKIGTRGGKIVLSPPEEPTVWVTVESGVLESFYQDMRKGVSRGELVKKAMGHWMKGEIRISPMGKLLELYGVYSSVE